MNIEDKTCAAGTLSTLHKFLLWMCKQMDVKKFLADIINIGVKIVYISDFPPS